MTRPRFKMDGRQGTMRWTHADGTRRFIGTRLHRMPYLAAQQVVAGTGRDFECRTVARRKRTKWAPLRMTYEEAVDYLGGHWQFEITFRNCTTIRARRVVKGLPLYSENDYERNKQ